MNELKVIKAYFPTFDADHNEMLLVSHTKENYMSAKQIECYLKSEADKVIENRDAEIARLKDSIGKLLKAKTEQVMDEVLRKCLIYGEGFVPVEHAMRIIAELRHSNYKRCLAMASTCRLRARWFGDNAFYKKEQWALNWHNRWLELAEKFKEEK